MLATLLCPRLHRGRAGGGGGGWGTGQADEAGGAAPALQGLRILHGHATVCDVLSCVPFDTAHLHGEYGQLSVPSPVGLGEAALGPRDPRRAAAGPCHAYRGGRRPLGIPRAAQCHTGSTCARPSKKCFTAQLVRLRGLSAGLGTAGWLVRLPVRARAWAAASAPGAAGPAPSPRPGARGRPRADTSRSHGAPLSPLRSPNVMKMSSGEDQRQGRC